MGRIRTIKPEFPQSESMGRVSRDARLTFIQLWTLADDEGRLRGNSRMLASLLFPYDEDAQERIDSWLGELEREGCIARYLVAGDAYLQLVNWAKHQRVDRPSPSKIPPFDGHSRGLSNPREDSTLDQGSRKGPKDLSSSGKPDRSPSDADSLSGGFTEFWQAYPRKVAKPQAVKAWRKLKPDTQTLTGMLAGLERDRRSDQWLRDGGQFIPHPATWLNGRRWEDEGNTPAMNSAEAEPWVGAI